MVETIIKKADTKSSIPELSAVERLAGIENFIRREGPHRPPLGQVLDLLEVADKIEPDALQVIVYSSPKYDTQRLAEAALERGRKWAEEADKQDALLLKDINRLARMGRRTKRRHP